MTVAAESTENLWYLCTTLLTLLMYTVASPDPDPDPNPVTVFVFTIVM